MNVLTLLTYNERHLNKKIFVDILTCASLWNNDCVKYIHYIREKTVHYTSKLITTTLITFM